MIQRMLKLGRVAAVLFFGLALGGLALGVAPAAAGGCGWGCGVAPVVVVPVVPVYPACSCCGCGGYGAYAPGYAYYGGSAAYGYAAAYAPYAYTNRFYRPRVYVGGPRRVWR
jgi:hypothetical protein